jgi:hypothetical protein
MEHRRRVGGRARLRKYRLIISCVLRASRVLYSRNTQRRRRLRADATKIEERPVDSRSPPGQKCVARPCSLLARLRRRSVRRSPPNSCFHYSLGAARGASSFRPLRCGLGNIRDRSWDLNLLLLPPRVRCVPHLRFREFLIRLSSHRLKTRIRNIRKYLGRIYSVFGHFFARAFLLIHPEKSYV